MGEMGRGPDGPVTVLAQRGNLGLGGAVAVSRRDSWSGRLAGPWGMEDSTGGEGRGTA